MPMQRIRGECFPATCGVEVASVMLIPGCWRLKA
jgi:hypothetical protein